MPSLSFNTAVKLVEQAAENAHEYQRNPVHCAEAQNPFGELSMLEDHAVVIVGNNDRKEHDYQVELVNATDQDYETLLLAASCVTNNLVDIGAIIRHERQHVNVITPYIPESVYLGLSMLPTVHGNLQFEPYMSYSRIKIPKIVFAACAGAPLYPSEGDRNFVRNLGYGSIRNLSERIMQYNSQNKSKNAQPVPVPLSYCYANDRFENLYQGHASTLMTV